MKEVATTDIPTHVLIRSTKILKKTGAHNLFRKFLKENRTQNTQMANDSSDSDYNVEEFVKPKRVRRTVNDDTADLLGNFDDIKRQEILNGTYIEKETATDSSDGEEEHSDDEKTNEEEATENGEAKKDARATQANGASKSDEEDTDSDTYSSMCEIKKTEGLLSIALKTIKLVKRNQLLQRRLAQLQLETSEFIQSVMANPENRHIRNNMNSPATTISSTPSSPSMPSPSTESPLQSPTTTTLQQSQNATEA